MFLDLATAVTCSNVSLDLAAGLVGRHDLLALHPLLQLTGLEKESGHLIAGDPSGRSHIAECLGTYAGQAAGFIYAYILCPGDSDCFHNLA